MKTNSWHKGWRVVLVAGAVALAGWAYAQQDGGPAKGSDSSYRVKPTTPTGVGRVLDQMDAKLNRIIQQQGGRYVFLVSTEGDLWRLDTFTGQVAVLDLVQGAQWGTLDVPEVTWKKGNAFYELYVQKLDGIDFNTN